MEALSVNLMEALVDSGKPLIEAVGIFLPYCSEAQIDGVETLTVKQKNALKCERNRLIFLGKLHYH